MAIQFIVCEQSSIADSTFKFENRLLNKYFDSDFKVHLLKYEYKHVHIHV